MPATRKELFGRLDELGIKTQTVEHEAVFTVAESERLERSLPGGHTKNLFLKDAKGRLFLVIAESHTAVDLKTLHKTLGCARLSFGKADLLMDVLGIPAGSVTALSLINDRENRVSVVIDFETLCGTTASIAILWKILRRLTSAATISSSSFVPVAMIRGSQCSAVHQMARPCST